MYGAIIGDVAGSYLEVLEVMELKNKTKRTYEERIKVMNDYPLFDENSSYTDDTVLTVAIADAIMNNIDYEEALKSYAKEELSLNHDKYGRSRFGKGFVDWVESSKCGHSYGNGSAMRVGPVGFLFDDLNDVIKNAYLATIPSHNHEEAIIGAEQVAVSVYLARMGNNKEEIKKYLEENYKMNLNFDLEDLRKNNRFSSKCINTVDKAIYCFLISNDFENAIRISLSIGGDSDTIAAITGSISEAYYGVPKYLIEQVDIYVPDKYKMVINQFYKKNKTMKYKK